MLDDTEGKKLATDAEGYLVDPLDWDENVALLFARQEQIELGDEHWKIIRFMRKYYEEHQIAADARFVKKLVAKELNYGKDAGSRMAQLFPYGYVKQACKIAGMKRPRAWSTG